MIVCGGEGEKTYYIVVCPWENAEDNFGGSYTLYLVPKHEYVAETLIEAEALATESSLRTLVSKSDLIAEVMAEGSHIETIKGTVFTVTSLRIMHTVKGDYNSEKVDVKVLGGGVDGDTLYLTPPSGYHHFIEGRPYLVFLKLYESSPASSVSSGASYSMTGKAFENYVTLSGQSAGFDEYMLYMAEDDYLRLSSTDLTEYLKIDTGKTYKKGRYIGEVEYDADSMTPGASVSGIISNCLPVGTKLYFAEGDDLTVIAEVGGEQLVFYAQVEE